ncbi:hypothetical protein PtB15_12B529 [Puccinia triticina]|nr:hypothetical protein PtB15_12B529 [Puccinia triticina]
MANFVFLIELAPKVDIVNTLTFNMTNTNTIKAIAPAQQLAVSNSAPSNHSAIPRPNPASNAAQ